MAKDVMPNDTMPGRTKSNDVLGAVLIDKPAGPTSHDVVARVRRALGTRAVGHTGTLDPFATGLLITLAGRATRLARFVEAQPKTYLATARLGARTTTDDLTGTVVGQPVAEVNVPEATIREVLASFEGTSAQRPPSFSAKRVDGQRSYRLARRGTPVPLADVIVTVHRITLVAYEPPRVIFRATVSAGTYLRAIARDLGERLGVGAHLIALRREAIGDVSVDDAVPLDAVSPETMVPALRVLGHLPTVKLDEMERQAVAHGRNIARDAAVAGHPAAGLASEHVALVAGDEIVAMATAGGGVLHPIVVLEGK